MPKTAPCPACRSKVKIPRDARAGDSLTCPDCDEVFTPPELRVKPRGLDDENAYEVRESREEEDLAEEEIERKLKKVRAIRTAGHQYAERFKEKDKPLFGPMDVMLLVLTIAASLGAVVGFIAAKRAPHIGEGVLIALCYCGVLAIFAYRIFFKRRF